MHRQKKLCHFLSNTRKLCGLLFILKNKYNVNKTHSFLVFYYLFKKNK